VRYREYYPLVTFQRVRKLGARDRARLLPMCWQAVRTCVSWVSRGISEKDFGMLFWWGSPVREATRKYPRFDFGVWLPCGGAKLKKRRAQTVFSSSVSVSLEGDGEFASWRSANGICMWSPTREYKAVQGQTCQSRMSQLQSMSSLCAAHTTL
jgi:hypothetical protein